MTDYTDPDTGFSADELMTRAVNRLFKRLAATYGAEWDRSLGQTPIEDAKAAWVHELAPFRGSLHRVSWALENMPERCPNPVVFKNLCRQAPAPGVPQLPEPSADPVRMAQEVAKLDHLKSTRTAHVSGLRDWAHRMRHRHTAGEALNPNQIRCYQAAIGVAA